MHSCLKRFWLGEFQRHQKFFQKRFGCDQMCGDDEGIERGAVGLLSALQSENVPKRLEQQERDYNPSTNL
jgi:hypothetical protein